MDAEAGNTRSVWLNVEVPEFERLEASTQADVCVVGGGIAGLTCAYLLSKEGKSVVLLDDGPICSGETQRTTAHLSNVIDDRYTEIERMHGKEKARLARDSHTAAIEMIQTIAADNQIDCDLIRVDGYLFLAPETNKSFLDKELKAARNAGFTDVEALPGLPFDCGKQIPCLLFPNQAQFHVLKYLRGVAQACLRQGVRIYAHTHVSRIRGGSQVVVETASKSSVTAKSAIIATNSPIHGASEFTKQAAYRSYVIAARVPVDSLPRALYWDTADPYHYVRTQPCEEDPSMQYVIVGGEDHKTGQQKQPEQCFEKLLAWAQQVFPMVKQIDLSWSGQVYEPADAFPFIGKDPSGKENVYMTTGDSGMGMTHGTMAGIILTDLIMERANPWARMYDPARKVLAAPVEFLKENMNTGLQYVRNLTADDVGSVDEIPPGEGAVISRGGEKIAVYRDLTGQLHERSAVCSHMAAIVCWNTLEKSWDCPAHGSRFSAQGSVINGPANKELGQCKNCKSREAPSDNDESRSASDENTHRRSA